MRTVCCRGSHCLFSRSSGGGAVGVQGLFVWDGSAASTKNTTAQPPPDKPKNDHETARPNAIALDIDLASQERAAALAEHVRAVVDSFPPLTPEQRDRIGALLHARGEGRRPRHDKRLAHREALADALRHGSD